MRAVKTSKVFEMHVFEMRYMYFVFNTKVRQVFEHLKNTFNKRKYNLGWSVLCIWPVSNLLLLLKANANSCVSEISDIIQF